MTTLDEIEAAIWHCIEADASPDWPRDMSPFVIIERGPHYVQLKATCDRPLYAEVVSNRFLDGEVQLTPLAEEALLAWGWNEPSGEACDEHCIDTIKADHHPNYWQELPDNWSVAEAARFLARTAESTFRSPLRRFVLKVFPAPGELRWYERDSA